MSDSPKAIKPIPKLYKRTAIHLLMFGYIQGCTDLINTVSIEVALEKFRRRYDLSEEDLPTDSALTAYQRIKKDYLEL